MTDASNSLAQEDSESEANSDAETMTAVEDNRQDGEDSEPICAPSVPAYLQRMPPLYNSIKDGRPFPFLVLAIPFPHDDILKFSERYDWPDSMGSFNRTATAYREANLELKGIAKSGIVYNSKDPDKITTAFYYAHNGSEAALNLARNEDTPKRIKEVLGDNREPLWLRLE